jgi:threonine dehydratase
VTTALPTVPDIEAAAARLAGEALRTPLLPAPTLDRKLGGRLLIKAESLQRTGSFKFRGAYNALAQMDTAARRAGVVAYSSGNHAQGVAAAAAALRMPAVIVMPADAPQIKVANTKAYGAEIVFYDRYRESREEIAARIARERGAVLLPPFDDARVIAGQGTIGLELCEQARALELALDAVVVPVSGGGLIGGIALALSVKSPRTEVHAAEPEGFDDLRRSLEAGTRLANAPGGRTICDALMAPMPGILTFALAQRHVTASHAVSDAVVAQAMAAAFAELKLVAEPGGAAALAAVLAGKIETRGRTVAVVLSGGNVDAEMFCRAIART